VQSSILGRLTRRRRDAQDAKTRGGTRRRVTEEENKFYERLTVMTFCRRFYKLLFSLAILAGFSLNARAQSTVTVSGDIKSVFSGSPPSDARVKICFNLVDLTDKPIADPRVPGVGVLIQDKNVCTTPINGHYSISVYGNDVVTVLGQTNVTMYDVIYLLNNNYAHGSTFILNAADVAVDLNTKSEVGTPPVVIPPVGDSTYLRLIPQGPLLGPLQLNSHFSLIEKVAPTCAAGFDFIWADSTAHKLKECANGGSAFNLTQDSGLTTGQVPKANSSGVLVASGITDDGTTVNIASEKLNAPGNLTQGTVSLKYASADHIIYVSPSGSDSNDGLSPGSAKLTTQAAIDAATSSGTVSGTVLFTAGTFSCPTTWRSNLSLISLTPLYQANYGGSFGAPGTILSGTLFNCGSGSNHTIDTVSNIHVEGITIYMNNAGGGLVIKSVMASKFIHFGVAFAGSGSQPAIKLIPGAATPTNNTAFNYFADLAILTATNASTDCLTLAGTGTPNAGPAVTDNEFHAVTCTGTLKHGIDFELNTDTNKIYGAEINNIGAAAGDVLVFNSATPASDQDADNEIVDGICFTGAFSHLISMGASFGNHIRMCSGTGEIAVNVLGGSPQYILQTTGLFGIAPVLNVAGTLHANNPLAAMQFACTGTATASSTLVLPVSSGTCTLTSAPLLPVGSIGTIKNLACRSLTGGVNGSSGVMTVRKNITNQSLTCTFGTSISCSDTSHSFSVVTGDTVDIIFATQAAETLANVACSVQFR
jgi:hypothetical protein